MKKLHGKRGGEKMNLKEARNRAGLTQQDIADKLKIDRSSVAKWESGEVMPRADKLKQLSEILGCTIDDLLSEQKGVVSNANDTKSLL